MSVIFLRLASNDNLLKGAILIGVLVIALEMSTPGAAQTAEQRWSELKSQTVEAYRAGNIARATKAAEAALEVARLAFGDRHPNTLGNIDNLAWLYEHQGRYGDAAPLRAEALALNRKVYGERHPNTLVSLGKLAGIYARLGRFREAEPLYAKAMALSEDVLGRRHPRTLENLSDMAMLYVRQGRYGEAEPLLTEVLALAPDVLGPRHPGISIALNNLAHLYLSQGRYGEAEPLFAKALEHTRDVLGPRHPQTLGNLTNLAWIYQKQARHNKAEPLFAEALAKRREVLGHRHPDTLSSLNNLATNYDRQGKYGEAEPLFTEALALSQEVLGPHHPQTLAYVANLAWNYLNQGQHKLAEQMLEEVLALRQQALGLHHPDTLKSLSSLAAAYWRQGQYGKAAPLLTKVLTLSQEVLGPNHPETLNAQLLRAVNQAAFGNADAATRLLSEMEVPLLTWLGAELYSIESTAVRRGFVASQADYQHLAISLAVQNPHSQAAQRLAATALLRFKGLQAEEEAYLARLIRRGRDAKVRQLADKIRTARDQLARSYHRGADPEKVEKLTRELDARELELGQLSRDYRAQLMVRGADLTDLQQVLAGGRMLVEFRRYRLVDFGEGTLGHERWAAVVVQQNKPVRTYDLASVAVTSPWIQSLATENGEADAAAKALYATMIAPLSIDQSAEVIISPDDHLNLVPFHRLMPNENTHWTEVQTLRVVQSGRDLLRPPHDRPAKGLLALGGIDFGEPSRQAPFLDNSQKTFETAGPQKRDTEASRTRAASVFSNGFDPLPGSAAEISVVAAYYQDARPQETVIVWDGSKAAEGRLMSNVTPPRVLHLATHGFYRAPEGRTDRPMLLAGIALAGANEALRAVNEDGILYALEAQDLNLEGTELVVLSACETAQGVIGYGEGVYGLVRALRTAGALHVLVTLRPIGDQSTARFMKVFYDRWLDQPTGQSDPAQAPQETQRHYIKANPDADWKPFVVVGVG